MILYHGTLSSQEFDTFQSFPAFLTPSYRFAMDYGYQKSFEGQLDADVKVLEFELLPSANVFDPQNEEHRKQLGMYLPETIEVFGSYFQSAHLKKEDFLEALKGECIKEPTFLPEDLLNAKPGTFLPDRRVYQHPKSYVFLASDNDTVFYAHRNHVSDFTKARRDIGLLYMDATLGKIDKKDFEAVYADAYQEWLKDIIELSGEDYFDRYKLRAPSVYSASRHPEHLKDLDIWFYLESPGVFDAIKKAGFNAVKSKEKGEDTYAVLSQNIILKKTPRLSCESIAKTFLLEVQSLPIERNEEKHVKITLSHQNTDVGYIAFYEHSSVIHVHNSEIYNKELRKKGLGSFLLNAVQAYANTMEKPVILEVLTKKNIDMLKRNGFEVAGDWGDFAYDAKDIEAGNDILKQINHVGEMSEIEDKINSLFKYSCQLKLS